MSQQRDRGIEQRDSSQPPSKSVQFDLDTPTSTGDSSPDHIRKRRQRASTNFDENDYLNDGHDSEFSSFSDNPSTTHSSSSHSHRHRHSQDDPSNTSRHKHSHSHRQPPSNPNSSANTLVNSARSPSPTESDATVDLPERFNKNGERIPEKGEDPIKDVVDGLLGGKGLGKFVKGFLGGDDDPLGEGGRRRRHRRD